MEKHKSETGCVFMDGGGCIRNKNNTMVKGIVREKINSYKCIDDT